MYTTMIATISSTQRLPSEVWNALAAPWNVVLIVDGSVRSAVSWMRETASPSENPGFTSKESVTAGNWPKWLMACRPVSWVTLANVAWGISRPGPDLKYSSDSDFGSA